MKHVRVERLLAFRALLCMPRRAPSDLSESMKMRDDSKLHVRRIFAVDDCSELVPERERFNFVTGVVDIADPHLVGHTFH